MYLHKTIQLLAINTKNILNAGPSLRVDHPGIFLGLHLLRYLIICACIAKILFKITTCNIPVNLIVLKYRLQ